MSIGTVISSIFALLLSLAFVLGLAWGGLWLLRKFQDGSFGKLKSENDGRKLRFERALPVGPRERLVLIEIDGEDMLLGVTAHSITTLKSWPNTTIDNEDSEEDPIPDSEPVTRPRFRLPMADRGDT